MTWKGNYGCQEEGIIRKTADKIMEYLNGLPESIEKISSRKLKEELGVNEKEIPRMTFTEAINQVSEEMEDWLLSGRSLVRN